jgi:hypothetical protein
MNLFKYGDEVTLSSHSLKFFQRWDNHLNPPKAPSPLPLPRGLPAGRQGRGKGEGKQKRLWIFSIAFFRYVPSFMSQKQERPWEPGGRPWPFISN